MPVILLAVLVFIVPGLILSLAIRIRGVNSVLLAPAFTVGITGFLAAVFPFLGISWGPLSLLLGVLVVAAVAWGIRYLVIRKRPDPEIDSPPRSLCVVVGFGALAAALVIGLQMATAMISPDSISQTYDNVFHLNAVRWAMETRDASPLNLGALTGISAYPAGWHGLVAIICELSGSTIPVAVNATNLAIGAVVWPLGCLYMVQSVAGHRTSVAIFSFIFAAGFSTFPMLMIDWGVLYPNLLSISVLPAALGLAFTAMGLGHHYRPNSLVAWLSLGVVVAGVALAHPSTFMAFLAFSVPAIVAVYYLNVRGSWPPRSPSNRRRVVVLSLALLAGFVGLTILWGYLRPPADAATWGVVETPPQAIGELLFNAPLGRPTLGVLSLCLAVGLIRLWVDKSRRWLIGMYWVGALFFFLAAGFNAEPRWFVTGVWYFDSYRLAALLPVVTIGPSVIGAVYLEDILRRRLAKIPDSVPARYGRIAKSMTSRRAFAMLAVPALAVIVLVAQLGPVSFAVERAHWQYKNSEHSGLLSPDERRLLARLPGIVESGATIAGLPSSGTSLAYALSDRAVIQPHILTTHGSDVDVINAGLKDAATFPSVCESVRKLNVRYVLDFGTRTVTGTLAGYGGVMDLEPNESLKLIDSEGPSARLFRVTACWE